MRRALLGAFAALALCGPAGAQGFGTPTPTANDTVTLTQLNGSGPSYKIKFFQAVQDAGGGGGSGTVTSVGSGTGLTGGPITTSGTLALSVPVVVANGGTNCTSASGTCLDNITGFSGTGYVTRTGAGTYSFSAAPSGSSILYGDGAGGFANVSVGTGLSFSGGLLSATGGSGSVTSVATNNGLTGGPITSSGTIGLASTSANTMLGNWSAGSAVPTAQSMPSCADTGGNHLNYVSGTGITCGTSDTHTGTVTSVVAGAGLSGGTITTTGTISLTTPVTVALGGTNATSASGTALDNITGFASTGFLTRTGAGAYSFQSTTNGITLANLAQSGANTMLGNWTGSTANVAANAMPSCADTGGNHLNYVSGTGITCGTSAGYLGTVTSVATNNGITGGTITSTGTIGLATIAANSELANWGSTTAVPTAQSMPSCSGTNNSLKYTTNTGVGCNTNTAILGANTFTGTQIASTSASSIGFQIDGAAATVRRIDYSTAGSLRWQEYASNDAESGGNAGSNFDIARFDDTGTFVDAPLSITRSSGLVTAADNFAVAGTTNTAGGILMGTGGGHLLCSATAPTISSGFGTGASIVASNGTCAFQINVGTGGSASSGVIGLPTATTGWVCSVTDITTMSTSVFLTKQTASSTTSATVGNFNTSAAATAWVASDKLNVSCKGY